MTSMPALRGRLRRRDHHAADAGAARRLHRRPAGHRGARRPRGARHVRARRARNACACSCATCSACRAASRHRSATRSPPRSASTAAAVLTSCIHTHAGPSTLEGSDLLGWVTPDGYRELLVERCVAAARAAAAAAAPADAARRPMAAARRSVDQPARAPVRRRRSPCVDVIGPTARASARSRTSRSIPSRSGPSASRCRATGSDRSARRSKRAPAAPRVLLSGALGDVNPHHVHRQNNDCGDDGFAEATQLGRDVAEGVDARARRRASRSTPTAPASAATERST